ncbi:hypothetical protein LUZ62_071304 [Rhynchospora pubera]|uniref:Thaumatin-like protein n=1 Tax=Rhynchospora pubera TaxID=906938 RepID=A0AAV8D1R0_9POAL|nr:hypothetical protein LUZ62_071304 [Rhynchospora pubera]
MASLKHLTLFLSLVCLLFLGHSDNTKPITIIVSNGCREVIYPAFKNAASNENPYKGGLQPKDQYIVEVDIYEGRIWPRTGCTFSSTGIKCMTGDCGGERCTADGSGDFTFAELIHTSGDHVNIGLKYNNKVTIPMSFAPLERYNEEQCKVLQCLQTGCGNNALSAACKIPNTFALTFCPAIRAEDEIIRTVVDN